MRTRWVGMLVVAGAVLAGCSDVTPWVDTAGLVDVDKLRVTGTEPVGVHGLVRLSPDGSRVMWMQRELCVTALDGSGERCVDKERVLPDPQRAQWSPDGTRIAFTDDFWRTFHEPDLWVYDVRSRELRNLTDDGVDSYELDDPDPSGTIDLLPSWAPDGESIRFARSAPESSRVELVSIGADGGDVSRLREVDCATMELSALSWSADRVAWTCGIKEPEVRVGEIEGADATTLLPSTRDKEDRMLLSFSPDGESLLVDSLTPYSANMVAEGKAKVVPVEGGDPVPVADGKVGFPTWAPGGTAIAYVTPPGTLNVVAEPGAEPRELREATFFAAADGMRLDWVPGALLVLMDSKPTKLTLED